MVVLPIDHCRIDRIRREPLRCRKPTEAGADNDDAGPRDPVLQEWWIDAEDCAPVSAFSRLVQL